MLVGHQKQWNFLKKKFESGQLAHAYLFSGEDKIGKKTLAKEFVKLISCLDGQACGICKNCKDIEKENHPDFLMVNLKNDKQEIEISQIREALNFLSLKSYYDSFKAVIVNGAEKMTFQAQSCFLKTLEEPKGKTIIFLISSKPDLLLPAVISRCQEIKFFQIGKYQFSKEEQKILEDVLSVADSSLAVKFQYAKKVNLENNNLKEILEILQRYLRHLLFLRVKAENLTSKDYSLLKIKEVLKLLETIDRQISLTNVNPKLALEILLMEM